MRKRTPKSQKVRAMLEQGYATKEIVAKLKVKPQAVYQLRYQLNKSKGLGAIGTPAPVPTDGIGTPPKKPTRRVRAGTGINAPEPERIVTMPNGDAYVMYKAQPNEVMPITMIESPTLWQRVVNFFRGART